MLTLHEVARRHGSTTLFAGVSLRVTGGDRVALIGPNGAGKTTLMELVSGAQEADDGEVRRAKGLTVGLLPQEVAETAGRTVLDEVLAGARGARELEARMRDLERHIAATDAGGQAALLEEYARLQDRFELAGGYGVEAEARKILSGLGFAEERFQADVGSLSGGWMMRVALARLLLDQPDLLLLDEPTNHLDLGSVAWLEQFLQGYQGAVLLASHDRDFLNAIATRVVELSGGRAISYTGNYESFVAQRELRLAQQKAAARNQHRQVAQTERFIERFRYKASKARQVQSRIKELDKLERVEEPQDRRKAMRLRFGEPPRSGREVVRLVGVSKRYGRHTVYDGLDLVLERGQKIALVGPNGAGKSTLLKLLAGVLPPDGGERVVGHNVEVAYYAQHQIDMLTQDRTVLQELAAVVDSVGLSARSLAGAFLFSGEDVDKAVASLSGGERARLALAKLLGRPVNLLCMDEPTNHLDIASRDVLEDALCAYPGTVVLITHDRHLIRSVADTIIDVRDGRAVIHPGDFEHFVWKTGADVDGTRADGAGADPALDQGSDPGAGDRKRVEAERRNRIFRATKELRHELAVVEEALAGAEAEVADLVRALAEPQTYEDPDQVRELTLRHALAAERAAELMDRWERLATVVEEASATAEGPAGP